MEEISCWDSIDPGNGAGGGLTAAAKPRPNPDTCCGARDEAAVATASVCQSCVRPAAAMASLTSGDDNALCRVLARLYSW